MVKECDYMIGNKIEPFKIWCQKILPNVYDDSLSYYEYLCKMNEYLNEVITQMNTLTQAEEDFQAQLTQAWLETKNYIDNYFNNLDVQQEINNKLDAMALDGTLSALISPFVSQEIGGVVAEQIDDTVAEQIDGSVGRQIDASVLSQIGDVAPEIITQWLNTNVDPVGSAVTVDKSLSISGSAADAKVTGDKIKHIEDCFSVSNNLFDPTGVENGLLRTSDGTLLTQYTAYDTTGYIPVEYNDVIRFQFNLNVNNKRYDLQSTSALTFTNVCYYDEDKTFISGDSSTISTYLTVNVQTAKYMRVSTNGYNDIHNLSIIKSSLGNFLLPYMPYDLQMLVNKNNTPFNSRMTQFNLVKPTVSGTIKMANVETSTKALLLSVKCGISNFTSVEFGLDASNTGICKAVIDDTNVTVTDYRFGGSTIQTYVYAHGLTIQDEIGLQFNFMNDGKGNVSISSHGGTFVTPNINFVRNLLSVPYFTASATVTDFHFSCAFTKIDKGIWLFGDSYMQESTTRWIYYLNQKNYGTYLTDAYSGENSSDGYKSLLTLLQFGKPKYIVWVLGMNDGTDSGSAPNSTWLSYAKAVEKICDELDIELVYGTIPSVPNINNEYKNDYIRNSGYKYIDFAKGVGANSSGVWYSGMLSDDNVHPSESGGLALYNEAITDFPQLAIN